YGSPLGWRLGPTTVCAPVLRSSTIILLETGSWCLRVFAPLQMYHQWEDGLPGRPDLAAVGGRSAGASATASSPSRSTSTSHPLGSPSSTRMFPGPLKCRGRSASDRRRSVQPFSAGTFDPAGTGIGA